MKSFLMNIGLGALALGVLGLSTPLSQADTFRIQNPIPFRVNNAYVSWPTTSYYSRPHYIVTSGGGLFIPPTPTTYNSYQYPSGTTVQAYGYGGPLLSSPSYGYSNYYGTNYSQPAYSPSYGMMYSPWYGNYSYPGYGSSYGVGYGGSYSSMYGGAAPPISYSGR